MSLTPEQIEIAKAMRAEEPPRHWRAIANELKITEHSLRCAVQPGYREYREKVNAAVKRGGSIPPMPDELRTNARCKIVHFIQDGDRISVPPEVYARRERENERLASYTPTPTAAAFGDPPPWRSALARKTEGAAHE